MVVVLTVIRRFEIVATVEELGDIRASGAFNDELATGVIRRVVSRI